MQEFNPPVGRKRGRPRTNAKKENGKEAEAHQDQHKETHVDESLEKAHIDESLEKAHVDESQESNKQMRLDDNLQQELFGDSQKEETPAETSVKPRKGRRVPTGTVPQHIQDRIKEMHTRRIASFKDHILMMIERKKLELKEYDEILKICEQRSSEIDSEHTNKEANRRAATMVATAQALNIISPGATQLRVKSMSIDQLQDTLKIIASSMPQQPKLVQSVLNRYKSNCEKEIARRSTIEPQ